MGSCAPQKKKLTPEEIQQRKKEVQTRLKAKAQEEADQAQMKKHKQRVLKRLSPPKQKNLTEQQMKVVLNGIFDRYDVDKSGTIDIKEFRDLINDLSYKKTGEKQRYSYEDVSSMFFRLCRSQNYEIDRQQFYNIYKNIK